MSPFVAQNESYLAGYYDLSYTRLFWMFPPVHLQAEIWSNAYNGMYLLNSTSLYRRPESQPAASLSPRPSQELRLTFQAKILKASVSPAGWDVFILWYDMKEPLSSIITSQAMSGYLRLFRLLWTLKRVEHTLNRVWQVMSGIQRQLATIQGLSSQYGLPCPGEFTSSSHLPSQLVTVLYRS